MFRIDELIKATRGRLVSGIKKGSVSGISIDSRQIKKNSAFIAIKGNNFDGHNFIGEAIRKGAVCIIKEARYHIEIKHDVDVIDVPDSIRALGDIAAFWRKKFSIPVIAITGSNGKTTTKDMLAHILSKNFNVLKNEGTKNNQIGLPLALLALNPAHQIAVLELGTNHPGEIEYLARICSPNIAIITNIGPSHLAYFKDLKKVFQEKYSIVKYLKTPRILVLNADDDLLRGRLYKKTKSLFTLGFGVSYQADFFASRITYQNHRIEFCVNPGIISSAKNKFTLHTLGYNNIYNAIAATLVARIFGMEYRDISLRLSKFVFPEGRLKVIPWNKAILIDDTYNSNPNSLKQALRVLDKFNTDGRKIFIMGDMLELGRQARHFHQEFSRDVASICDIFISVGRFSRFLAVSAKAFGLRDDKTFSCDSAYQARDILLNRVSIRKGDVILLKGSRAMRIEEVFKTRQLANSPTR